MLRAGLGTQLVAVRCGEGDTTLNQGFQGFRANRRALEQAEVDTETAGVQKRLPLRTSGA